MKHDEHDPAQDADHNSGAGAPLDLLDDPRLTAYAFGELDAAEREAFEALLAEHPRAQAEVDDLRALGGVLERELQTQAAPTALRDDQRAASAAAAGGASAPPRGRLLSSPWMQLGSVAATIAGIGLLGFLTRDQWTGERFTADSAPSLSAAVETPSGSQPFTYNVFGEDSEAPLELDAMGYVGKAKGSRAAGSTGLRDLGYAEESEEQLASTSLQHSSSAAGEMGLLQGAESSAHSRGWLGDESSDPYRGPGDTVPPRADDSALLDGAARDQLRSLGYGAGSGGPATRGLPTSGGRPAAGPTAPGSPGAGAPGSPGAATESDGFFLGRGQKRTDSDEARRELPGRVQRPAVNTELYESLPENPFTPVVQDPRSTFSIDVDTASYANVRRFLRQGQLPPPAAVRIEELVNAFSYAYPAPTGEHPFAVHAELVDAPWAAGHKLLRVGLQGALPTNEEPVGRNLVFLVDVSGSMSKADKLPLVQSSLKMLVEALRPQDTIGLVTYSGRSGIALRSTPVSEKQVVLAAIDSLASGGSTNGAAGIVDAYALARETFVEGGVNRVVLATDGDFNVGLSSPEELEHLIEQKRETGIYLSVLGFGTGNLKDAKMETLADKGNGNYSYIDSLREARKVLVRNLDGTLETIAQDVKLQLEFNPLRIASHRLIGYENRKLAHRDFLDDRKDAGEIGAGHSVTALYELVPVGADLAGTPPLKYQQPGVPSEPSLAAGSNEALTVSLRYKLPGDKESRPLEVVVEDTSVAFDAASQETRFAAAVASFGMLLRGSQHKGATSFEAVHAWAAQAKGADPHGDRAEFLTLVDWARQASGRTPR